MDITAILSDGVEGLTTTLTGVAPVAIGVGASVLALTFGWKLVKKFAK